MAYVIDRQHPASTSALGGNLPYTGFEWHSPAIPDYLIYVFNISARTFCDPSNTRVGIIGRIKLRAEGVSASDPTEVTIEVPPEHKGAKPTYKVTEGRVDQPYHYVVSFPQPMLVPNPNDQSGQLEVKETDGLRFVIDTISPDNLTHTLDTVIDAANAWSIGNDYAPRGIFISLRNPPLQSDVEKAYARMENYYRQLNEKIKTLELTDKMGMQRAIDSNPDHHYAANYFGQQFGWNKKQVRPVECPNCGEQKPAGRLFHQTSFGSLCVEQTVEAWKSVVNSGVKPYSSVPDDFKWKGNKTAPSGDGNAGE